MARTYTPEQLAAINTTDRTLLLSAAAGSGKTATLTERLIRMITNPENPLDVSRMLIATFTRAAAGELRERISAALSAAIEKDPANKRLARQALLLPTAKIRTIDAFCHDLVRGHTDSLGISPLYRIPDEAEVELLAREIMDDLIEDVYRGDYQAEGLDIFFLSESLISARMEASLGAKLWDFYKNSIAGRLDGVKALLATAEAMAPCAQMPFFDTPIGKTLRDSLKEEITTRMDLVRQMAEKAKNTETEKMATALLLSAESLSENFTSLLQGLDTSYTAFRDALALPLSSAKQTKDNDLSPTGKMCKAFRAECSKFRNGLSSDLSPWSEDDLGRLYGETQRIALSLALLLAEFETRFLAAKREKGLCEYGDLSLYAYHLLLDEKGEKTPLAQQLTDSFDVVCVDEYQDVNELQHKIFEAVSSPTNRFMVGDIKQSIYGFRGAEPSIFASLRASFPSLSEKSDRAVLYLTRNFRSAARILDLANGVFDFLFGTIGESIGYTERDRLYLPEAKEGEPPRPDTPTPALFLLPGKAESDDEGGDELSFVVRQVKTLLAEGHKRDGSPIRPADIAILTRSNAAKHKMLMALESEGLPTFYEEDEDFFSYSEILLALCLCHAVNNPRRDIYLAGLLRSPLYRFTMEELVRIRRFRGETLYDDLCRAVEEEDFPKGRAFLDELNEFRRLAEGERADRLLRHLFDKTAIAAALDEEAQNRLYRFYDLARRRESLSFHGLYAFLAYVDEMIAAGKSTGGKISKGTALDGIYVNTIHRSKGLEFPICILTGCGARLSADAADRLPVRYFPFLGFASPVASHEGMGLVSSPLYRILDAHEKNSELEEEARVLYVALTRPKEQLILTAAPTKKIENFLADAALLRAFPSRFMLASRRNYAAWIAAAL
ncbi:MAG: UvrD-helicase domain-containing protein, partial [Clostridia bacterium]|nr:UvrD-helicase domain-containing protein [Clostridia bacterium]